MVCPSILCLNEKLPPSSSTLTPIVPKAIFQLLTRLFAAVRRVGCHESASGRSADAPGTAYGGTFAPSRSQASITVLFWDLLIASEYVGVSLKCGLSDSAALATSCRARSGMSSFGISSSFSLAAVVLSVCLYLLVSSKSLPQNPVRASTNGNPPLLITS